MSLQSESSRLTDRELLLRARAGKTWAFDELVLRHHRMMNRIACSIVRSSIDAEDVAQDAWLQAYRHLEQFRGTASVTTWLVAIVRNKALDHVRARRREIERPVSTPLIADFDAPTPEDIVLGHERRARLARYVRELSAPLRNALRLWHSGRYTYDEIAHIAGVPTGTVRSRISQARQRVSFLLASDAARS